MKKEQESEKKVKLGEFPFPLRDGPQESPYLTWIRNHSNYMAVRGLFDYLRAVGVLVRGIVVNFLILLPFLLLVSIALGYGHHWMLEHPFGLTVRVMMAALAWVLLFPVVMPLFKIFMYKRSLETGSESSIKTRDRYERSFGVLLFAFVASAVLETLPWALEFLHELIHSKSFGWTGVLASLAAALVVLSGSDRLLKALSGVKRQLAVVLIGVLGLAVPLLVIIFAAEFLVYGRPPTPITMFSPLVVPIIGVIGLVIAIPVGWLRGAFRWRELFAIVGMIVAGLLVVWIVMAGGDSARERSSKGMAELQQIIEPFQRVASEIELIAADGKVDMDEEVAALVDELVTVQREYKISEEDVEEKLEQLRVESERLTGKLKKRPNWWIQRVFQRWQHGYDQWIIESEVAKQLGEYFESGQQFVVLGDKFSALRRGRLESLRREIIKRAHQKLLAEVDAINALQLEKIGEEERATLARSPLARSAVARSRFGKSKLFAASATPGNRYTRTRATDSDTKDRVARKLRGKLVELCLEELFENESPDRPSSAGLLVQAAADQARRELEEWSAEELTRLVDRNQLEEIVMEERLKDIADQQQLNREIQKLKNVSKEELARRLSKEEIIHHLFEARYLVDGKYFPMDELKLLAEERLIAHALEESPEKPATDRARTLVHLIVDPKPHPEVDVNKRRAVKELEGAKDYEEDLKKSLKQVGEDIGKLKGEKKDAEDSNEALESMNEFREYLEQQVNAAEAATKRAQKAVEDADEIAKKDAERRAEVARDLLAKLAVAQFSAKQLEAALLRWDLDEFPDSEETFESRRREVFGTPQFQNLELTKHAPLLKLVEKAFPKIFGNAGAAKRDGDEAPGAGYYFSEADYYKLLLAESVLGKSVAGQEERDLEREKRRLEEKIKGLEQQEETIPAPTRDDAARNPSDDQNNTSLEESRNALQDKEKALKEIQKRRAELARDMLLEKGLGLGFGSDQLAVSVEASRAREVLGRLSGIDDGEDAEGLNLPFEGRELERISAQRFKDADSAALDSLVATLIFGKYGPLDQASLKGVKEELTEAVIDPKAIFILLLAAVLWLGCWLTVDVNLTSVHGLYRDRLASAFLVGEDTKGDVDIEEDIDLEEICRHDARSIAPYHLVNVALNLQGSKDIGIRDRNSDFFIYSKRFIGGDRTGYCRSETMEQVFPQMSLATAMAVSAAAASPNMGRGTSPLLVAFMSLLNIRLGYWMPNPGLLEERQNERRWKQERKKIKKRGEVGARALGYKFEEVFAAELDEVKRRWEQVYRAGPERSLAQKLIEEAEAPEKGPVQMTSSAAAPSATSSSAPAPEKAAPKKRREIVARPTVRHSLFGVAFSGGGIRSATINLGIAQALDEAGVFKHFDYMSTVSGGGYLGSSLSTLMRGRTKLESEVDGTVKITVERAEKIVTVTGDRGTAKTEEYRFAKDAELEVRDGVNVSAGKSLVRQRSAAYRSDRAGTVRVDVKNDGRQEVEVAGNQPEGNRTYHFSRFEKLCVKTGNAVLPGDPLVNVCQTMGDRFRWRVRPTAFLREIGSKLDERYRWVNLSDGGHIENLATIELLRRRCKFIIIGDGEADPNLSFNGLATLIRTARIDLGVEIDINLDKLRLKKCAEGEKKPTLSKEHWAIGTITYPARPKREESAADNEKEPAENENENEKPVEAKNEHEEPEVGLLLYLKSSFTGDEGEVIREYRRRNPSFPHQSTADQMFDEGQFEAYRSLGEHIAKNVLDCAPRKREMTYCDVEGWFIALAKKRKLKWRKKDLPSCLPNNWLQRAPAKKIAISGKSVAAKKTSATRKSATKKSAATKKTATTKKTAATKKTATTKNTARKRAPRKS